MSDYRVSPLVQELPATVPFVGPETQERNQGYLFKARIGANESVFGPSPNAIQAMADAASESWMYGDPEFHDLREDLAAHHQVESGNIMVGEGIDGMLGYVARMFLQPGDTVVTSAGAYPTFNYHVNGYGGKLEFVPYRDDHEDLDALIHK
ncbi:MAG: aminotransferase class I/II-fold pyridoxal phosphate-dependent enzyme, partial [SAR324 cluster bacterium]|nr:aminotransferase class I/II-fold pyridoxal phosphate-dependent enzyme [SAR324 cluster bacterium]